MHDPSASASFAETHVRRLEAMRRLAGTVERESDGTWIIAPDHLEPTAAYERRQAKDAPVVVQTLSALPLDRQFGAEGATWLDRELIADTPVPLRDGGFGREVQDALVRRRQWLIEQELARDEQDRTIFRANMLGILRRRELTRAGSQLSDELGLDYVEISFGKHVSFPKEILDETVCIDPPDQRRPHGAGRRGILAQYRGGLEGRQSG